MPFAPLYKALPANVFFQAEASFLSRGPCIELKDAAGFCFAGIHFLLSWALLASIHERLII